MEQYRRGKAAGLRKRERQPEGRKADVREQHGGGQEEDKLTQQRHDKRLAPAAQSLHAAGQDDGNAGKAERSGDDADGGDAEGEHGIRGVEQPQKRYRCV